MKKIIPLLERLFSLLVVFLLLAATALWSGKFLGREWLTVQDSAESGKVILTPPSAEELRLLGIADMQLAERDTLSWTVKSEGKKKGVVLSSEPFAEDHIAYAGTTPLFVYVSDKGIIKSIVPMENNETPSFFKRASDGILNEWNGLEIDEAVDKEVDAVTGATYSSQGLIGNVQTVLSAYADLGGYHFGQPTIGWVRTIALFLVFGLGLFATWRFKGKRWVRILTLILNVGITGFWCGQFLSLSLLRGWIENGVDVLLYLPTLVMLVIAVIMPYFGKANHYCNWMCPYGSLQELAWHLPLPKVKISAKAYRRMRKFRMGVLMVLLFCLWMGWGMSVLDYEPFSAFLLMAADPVVIVLASAFVIAGIFVPHPWCRCVCPVGTLLNLAEDKK